MKPFYKQLICDTETPVSLYLKLAQHHSHAFLFESGEQHESKGRYSFLGFGAKKKFIFEAGEATGRARRLNEGARNQGDRVKDELYKKGTQNPLEVLKKAYEAISYEPSAELPMLQAGFVGYFSYETARHFEPVNLPIKPAVIPEAIFFLPAHLIIFDHLKNTVTFVAYDEKSLQNLLDEYETKKNMALVEEKSISSSCHGEHVEPRQQQHSAAFECVVESAKEKICAGEIFQIVLSQEFHESISLPPFDIYRRLRSTSPSPYLFYLQFPDFSIIGSSPETLVRVEKNEIILRPIAGTRPRGKTEPEDQKLAEELRNDIKEQAEHMMLLDLGRNDIGRVSVPGSVRITQDRRVELFSHVMHLVSEIRGKKSPTTSLFDVFRACFPAGTLTGAPKIRAMQLIAEFEKTPRGIYGGAVGYFDLSGNMDFAIAIRTLLYSKGETPSISLRAGAGIVYDSKPREEHRECLHKAKAPLSALTKTIA